MHALCTKSKISRFSWSWTAIPYPVGIEMDALEVPSQMFEVIYFLKRREKKFFFFFFI